MKTMHFQVWKPCLNVGAVGVDSRTMVGPTPSTFRLISTIGDDPLTSSDPFSSKQPDSWMNLFSGYSLPSEAWTMCVSSAACATYP